MPACFKGKNRSFGIDTKVSTVPLITDAFDVRMGRVARPLDNVVRIYDAAFDRVHAFARSQALKTLGAHCR